MKSDIQCLYCLIKQAYNTARIATSDKSIQRRILNLMADKIPQADLSESPAVLSTPVYSLVSEVTGIPDPYYQIKRQTNREAMALIPQLHPLIDAAADPLDAALHLAVAGNIIDLGIGHEFNIAVDIKSILHVPFAVNNETDFREELTAGRKLLYLGDNSGEIVFDRLLIEYLLQFDLKITYVVKSGPIINDVLMEDAEEAGITSLVPVIKTGSSDIGVNFNNASGSFIEAFESADVIISKGHGNFESCEHRSENIYFLLKAKCEVVADALGVNLGDIVFKRNVQK
ncbi:DUF89 family protein [bacterium]|nr:DUF89 family protein [bacterium]